MNRIFVLSVAFLALFSSACSFSPKAPSTQSLLKDDHSLVIEYLEKYIPAQMKKHKLTGLSVALVDDQQILWSKGFGFADKSADIKATKSTTFRAGSVSKLITAMAVMKLKEDQKVDLDASIKSIVPEFDLKTRFGSTDEITLRNILSHHAGIPGNIIDGMWSNEPDSFKTVTTRLHRYYAAYPPNTVFAYSNAGYSVAGHAVENSSGMPFTDYINDSLLRPLQMKHSNMEFNTTGGNVAKSYWEGREVQELRLRDLPAGGLVTTVGDLSNLVKLVNANGFYKSQIFMPETMQEMLAVQAYDSVYEPDGFNGIGWLHYSGFLDNKYTVVGHTGQTMAHSASVVMVPEIKLGVVMLANSPSNGGLEKITDKILRLSHTVKVRKTLSSIAATNEAAKPLSGTETSFDGKYASIFGYLDINQHAESYTLYIGGKKMKLSKNSEGNFTLRAQLAGFIPFKPPGIGNLSFFAREVSGEKMILAQSPTGQTTLVATQLSAQQRSPVWDVRLGEYTLSNPIDSNNGFLKIDSLALDYADGFYYVFLKTPMGDQKIPLTVINELEATMQGYGRDLGETVIVQPDGSLLHAGLVFIKN